MRAEKLAHNVAVWRHLEDTALVAFADQGVTAAARRTSAARRTMSYCPARYSATRYPEHEADCPSDGNCEAKLLWQTFQARKIGGVCRIKRRGREVLP